MGDIPTRIERVELRCSNVEASAEFYSRLIGLEVATLDADRCELRAGGSGAPLLVLRRAARPGRAPRHASGLFHTAFRFGDRGGLAGALSRLEALGAPLTGASDHGVSEALYLDDPDGLGIELYRDRPLEEWPEPAPGERVRMFTAPLELGELLRAGERGRSGPAGTPVDIGHVHLKVGDLGAAERFWTERLGFELMTRFGGEASFLGKDGYHHHVGVNTWLSGGAAPEPADGPGLATIAIDAGEGVEPAVSPDGVPIETSAG